MYADATTANNHEHMVQRFYDRLVLLQEFEGMSDDEMESIYALGYNHFTYGLFERAKDIFVRLTGYAPEAAHYWRALGAVNQQLEQYTEAIASYDIAIAIDESDIVSYVYRAECHILSGNVELGLKDLNTVVALGPSDPTYAPWVDRARLLISLH